MHTTQLCADKAQAGLSVLTEEICVLVFQLCMPFFFAKELAKWRGCNETAHEFFISADEGKPPSSLHDAFQMCFHHFSCASSVGNVQVIGVYPS